MEKKSIYALCASIILGFFILGLFVSEGMKNNAPTQQPIQNSYARYQFYVVGNNLVEYDTDTEEVKYKYMSPDEHPTDWNYMEP